MILCLYFATSFDRISEYTSSVIPSEVNIINKADSYPLDTLPGKHAITGILCYFNIGTEFSGIIP